MNRNQARSLMRDLHAKRAGRAQRAPAEKTESRQGLTLPVNNDRATPTAGVAVDGTPRGDEEPHGKRMLPSLHR